MKISEHSFTNTDAEYDLIKTLLLAIETYPDMDNNWDPGRMDWWRYNYHAEKGEDFFRTNAHYWKVETGQIVALFISEYGKDDFFIVVHPNYWALFPKVLKWGLNVWARGKSKISTDIYSYGRQKIEPLTAASFYEDGHVENVRFYSLAHYDFSYNLKPGFTLMCFADYKNYRSKVKLVRNAFKNPNFSEVRLRSLQRSPGYRPELDLVIVNPQGESVGYCMGWVQESDARFAYIEPMGVHSDYRKQGFGLVLAKECFKRFAKLGVETAWIASNAEPDISNFLYDSLKPASVKRSYRYSLEISDSVTAL